MDLRESIADKMKEEKHMTLLDTILVFLGIKTETEIRMKESVELKAIERKMERENKAAQAEIERYEKEVLLLEQTGRHTEALAKARIAETKKKALRVSEAKLMKCREDRAIMETGAELTATCVKLTDLLRRTMKTGNAKKTLAAKTEFDTAEAMLDEQTEQVKTTLEIFDEGETLVMADEGAEAALVKIIAEHPEVAPVIAAAVPAAEPATVRPILPAMDADVTDLEWKRQLRDEIQSACAGN